MYECSLQRYDVLQSEGQKLFVHIITMPSLKWQHNVSTILSKKGFKKWKTVSNSCRIKDLWLIFPEDNVHFELDFE